MGQLPRRLAHNRQTMSNRYDDDEWAELVDPTDDVCTHCKSVGNIECKIGDHIYVEGHRVTCGNPVSTGGLVIGDIPINDPCLPQDTVDRCLAILRN